MLGGHDKVLAKYLKIIDDMGTKQLPNKSGECLFEIIMRRYHLDMGFLLEALGQALEAEIGSHKAWRGHPHAGFAHCPQLFTWFFGGPISVP